MTDEWKIIFMLSCFLAMFLGAVMEHASLTAKYEKMGCRLITDRVPHAQ